MCRFIAYIGNPLIVDDVLFKPGNSLINQSIHAREIDEPLNGDGFGLGWYTHAIDNFPGLFRSIQPAWNDLNLQSLAKKIRTDCFFAHVRAASSAFKHFQPYFPKANKIQLVKELTREKTYTDGLVVHSLTKWLSDFSLVEK